ncbi:MAG: DUF4388 domain-containing protein [Holophagaceae bacterium]|nr:DUF4388 domain-containing protein [Holophagaceae bacterium]
MALEGSLRDFDLFSLFNMIKIQGKSGTLVLSRGQEFVKVFFDQGEIVGCDSNQVRLEDRVGTMLVRLGRLSGEELMQIVQLQRQTLKLMGTLLLESGKVTAQDLQDALFNQAMAIIYRTFRWKEGDYRFDSMLPLDLDREHFLRSQWTPCLWKPPGSRMSGPRFKSVCRTSLRPWPKPPRDKG